MNRRNYYRVLHVQPDAPPEVVRAAYRALMARHHPDQGGGHEHAVLLNEAWGVLGDPARRAAYDAQRARAGRTPRAGRSPAPAAAAPPRADAPAANWPAAAPTPPAGHGCPFCGAPHAARDRRCPRCAAPLEPPPVAPAGATAPASADRRRLPRVTRADWGTIRLHWPGEPIDIRLRNLSLEGVSFYTGSPLAPGDRVRITAAAFDAVVDVIRCERSKAVFLVRGVFVTVRFAGKGGFIHTTA